MRVDPREGLIPTVKSRSQVAAWLRGAFVLCLTSHIYQTPARDPDTAPWPAGHPAKVASFQTAADIKHEKTDMSVAKKRFAAALDTDYLEQILKVRLPTLGKL